MRNRRNSRMTTMDLLYFTMIVNVWLLWDPEFVDYMFQDQLWFEYSWHSHKYATWTSVFVSLFTHSDWEHLLGNMLLLFFVGKRTFVNTPRQTWTSPFVFLWVYFGSQMASVCGCYLLSNWLDAEWEKKLVQGRRGWLTLVPTFVRDGWSTVRHLPQVTKLKVWQFGPGVGSSAAVYGIAGCYLHAAICCKSHPATLDKYALLFWSFKLLEEIRGTPFFLEDLSLPSEGDRIDHAAHLFGFLGGFLLASLWDLGHVKLQPRCRNQESH